MGETCKKKVNETMRDVGIIATYICGKPVYKEGMCLRHYRRHTQKLVPWSQRNNYKPATIEDFDTGRSLKLGTEHVNNIYRYFRGIIQKNIKEKWTDTEISPDIKLFVIKKL